MSGAETARRRVVQRRIGGAETAAPKCPSPHKLYPEGEHVDFDVNFCMIFIIFIQTDVT